MQSVVEEIRQLADDESRRSGLPGYTDGPADALRHIVGIAELRRRMGPVGARIIGDGNEILAWERGGWSDAIPMDLWNNRIGREIGARARTYEEVLSLSRDAIRQAIEAGATGEGGTAVWLPRERWNDGQDAPLVLQDNTPNAQLYRFGGAEQRWGVARTAREMERDLLEALAQTPPEIWTEQDVRAVIRSGPHRNSAHPDRAAWQERVRRYFEATVERERVQDRRSDSSGNSGCGGVAQVRAHTRQGPNGPVQVSAHTRAIPCG
jgi:hypothetical protein